VIPLAQRANRFALRNMKEWMSLAQRNTLE